MTVTAPPRPPRPSDPVERDAHEALIEEAGVEPSPVLTSIHRQILAHDPHLLPVAA